MERLWDGEMAHLLIVTLGPVQDFIEAARRTRELWFASWLLSELAKATAQTLAEECGLDALVFPGVSKPDELWPESSTSVANKIVVRVPDGKDPAAVAKRGEDGMRTRLAWLRDQAFDKIQPRWFNRETANAQVDDLIEFAWVSAPQHGDNGYADARRKAESLLAARKNTRLWRQVPWGAQVPKSSIDGERESVLHEDLFDRVGEKDGLTPEDVRKRYGVKPTERLCGVSLLKRHGTRAKTRYGHRFLSTGHLAAWPLYDRAKKIDDPALKAAWVRYLEALEKGGVELAEQMIFQGRGWSHSFFDDYDGSLLFENRLPELFEEVLDPDQRETGLRAARSALADFLKRLGVPTPLPYYAILVADGDRMGKAIERQNTFEKHRALSRDLDRFAQSVRSIVERDHGGALVYSGGDDVLALVPLHRAIRCARVLAAEFGKQLAGFPADDQGNPPTLSAGIGVSHFIDPLRGALELAREAEKRAKEKRNSLAVKVDKRSGPPVEITGLWGTFDQRLDDYVALHLNDQVPDGAAYELEELARLLETAKGEGKENLEKLVRSEAARILRRKQPEHGAQEKIDPKILDSLLADLAELSVGDVANRLIVARIFAQAAEQAGEKPAAPKAGGPA
jgi:CRISPR-associated protein Cmr2